MKRTVKKTQTLKTLAGILGIVLQILTTVALFILAANPPEAISHLKSLLMMAGILSAIGVCFMFIVAAIAFLDNSLLNAKGHLKLSILTPLATVFLTVAAGIVVTAFEHSYESTIGMILAILGSIVLLFTSMISIIGLFLCVVIENEEE